MTDQRLSLEEARTLLPPGLSAKDLSDLYEQLRRLDRGIPYFSPNTFDFDLQGDAFAEAPYVVVSMDAVVERRTRVMVLSNTCDIASENARKTPVHVTVAPMVRITKWRSIMASFGVSMTAIEDKLASARRHEISNLFYLPAGKGVDEESLVLLDQLQSLPAARFHAAKPLKLATLSQPAFWVLLVKLSIHFCRQQEGVVRNAA